MLKSGDHIQRSVDEEKRDDVVIAGVIAFRHSQVHEIAFDEMKRLPEAGYCVGEGNATEQEVVCPLVGEPVRVRVHGMLIRFLCRCRR